jgi:iron complex outermembrane receptor protein
MKKNTDSLAGMSWNATPLESEIDYLNLHMDYGIDLSEHWHAQFNYDWLKTDMRQADEYVDSLFTQYYGQLVWSDALGSNIFNGEYKNSTYTAELTYKEAIGNHHITAGMKGRYKQLDSFENNGQDALTTPFTCERIGSVFFQDQYALSTQELLTFGISYNHISRNGGVEDDSLLQLRLGYIYTSEHWSYKAYLYRNQFALEPLVRYLDLGKPEDFQIYQNVEPQTTLGITQEIAYSKEKQHIRLLLHTMQDENSLFQDRVNGLGQETKYFTSIFKYDYTFNVDNKMNLQLYYAQYRDIFNLDKLEDISGYLSFANSYENFDFYNGVVWHRNSLNWKNYFDLTTSISWNINEDLTLTLKGDNLLNKAKKTSQYTINPANGAGGALEISPIDQRIIFEVEYLF